MGVMVVHRIYGFSPPSLFYKRHYFLFTFNLPTHLSFNPFRKLPVLIFQGLSEEETISIINTVKTFHFRGLERFERSRFPLAPARLCSRTFHFEVDNIDRLAGRDSHLIHYSDSTNGQVFSVSFNFACGPGQFDMMSFPAV